MSIEHTKKRKSGNTQGLQEKGERSQGEQAKKGRGGTGLDNPTRGLVTVHICSARRDHQQKHPDLLRSNEEKKNREEFVRRVPVK